MFLIMNSDRARNPNRSTLKQAVTALASLVPGRPPGLQLLDLSALLDASVGASTLNPEP